MPGYVSVDDNGSRSINDHKLGQIRWPSQRCAFMDIDYNGESFRHPEGSGQGDIFQSNSEVAAEMRHGSGNSFNFCYVDGHVKPLLYDTIPLTYARTGGYLWGTWPETY